VLAEHTFELLSTDCGTWTKLDVPRAPCMQVLTTAPDPPAQARGRSSTLPSRPRWALTAWAPRLVQTPEVHCTSEPGPGQGHSCGRCGGRFTIGLTTVGSVLLDFVYLQPGPWGRLTSVDGAPLPVRRWPP
jgi:hypothetical protein